MIAACDNCLNSYTTLPSWYNRSKRHYCSRGCSLIASKEARIEHLLKVGVSNRFKPGDKPSPNRVMPKGSSHKSWKGGRVGYRGLHYWLRREKGAPNKCIDCNKTEGKLQWSNVDGKYRRDIGDYVGRCASCHKSYDLAMLSIPGSPLAT